jgi:signal peptidase I
VTRRKWLSAVGGVSAVVLVLGLGGFLVWSKGAASTPDQAAEDPLMARFHVVGDSMNPTIKDGDWLLIRRQETPQRGDVVVLRIPSDQTKLFCRRVVAVGGDRVVTRNYAGVKTTTVFSKDHAEGVVFPDHTAPLGSSYDEKETLVQTGDYFVVGDNTVPGASYDSDDWGVLPLSDIVGVVKKRTQPSPRTF